MEHNSAIGPFGSGNLWIRGLRSRALQPHPDFTYVHPQRRHFPCVWVQLVGDDCVHFAVNTPVRGAISVGAIAHSQHSMVQALTALRTWQIFPLMFSPFLCMHKSMMLANAGLAARYVPCMVACQPGPALLHLLHSLTACIHKACAVFPLLSTGSCQGV
eukprot:scaffold20383_cov22-Tisochrysis_lutea.AAC.3